MPFRIAKSFTVESGHLLTKHAGGCRFPHGHSRTIEIVVTSDALDANDMVCDFKALKAAAAAAVERFDHTFALNTADPRFAELHAAYGERVIPFENTDPTTEVLAREIFRAVRARLQLPHAKLERVRVTETATSWGEYWE
ncbi:MAG TPA: 6-carboxytetrahydropterin synthase [Opitutus sp.]|nr:6-carboxytetrahydropterin synthase [Opitutus sp.]